MKKKTNPLNLLIQAKLDERQQTLRNLAKYLGISYIHMTSLSGGARSWAGLKPPKQRLMAAYLGISLVEFYLLGGMLRKEDFLPPVTY